MMFGKSNTPFIITLLVILLGAWLRFHALAHDHRFHPDEALFSTFARSAAINGDWMLPGALDKTPLAIYANALSQVFIGDSEFAARLPGTFASILLIPVIGALARQGFKTPGYQKQNPLKGLLKSNRRPSSPFSGLDLPAAGRFNVWRENGNEWMLAMLLATLSPFAIAFSATALTDGLMLLFMTLALGFMVAGRWGWSGFTLALAFACKQQALFYLPLVLILGAVEARSIPQGLSLVAMPLRKCFLHFTVAFASVIIALLLWDTVRGETSIFALAAVNNDPWRLIRANEILPRMTTWLNEGQMLIGESWMTLVLILIAIIALVVRIIRQTYQRAVLIDIILFTFILAYGLLHWLVAFNTYDRYLLPILPPLILLVSHGIEWLARNRLVLIWLFLLLIIPAINAAEGRRAINDEYRQYEGIDDLAAYLNSKPVATVIYDRWLGWELAYYMGQWTDKRRVYYPTPDELVRGALNLCEIGSRYLPAPAQKPINPWLEALWEAGFDVAQVYETRNFVVYEIIPSGGASSAESSSPDPSGSCGDEPP